MTETRTCECGQVIDPEDVVCDACLAQCAAEVFAERYKADPAFRAEADRWVSLN